MSRIPMCNCPGCANVGTVKVDLNRRGGRNVYLCERHANSLEGYSFENETRTGTDKVNGFTFGCEFETSFSTLKARQEIIANGYVPTSDCTVNVEYKSPIMQGLNSLSKQGTTYDKLIASGDLSVGDECGTHFHVGHKDFINRETIDYMRRFYNSLFVPLSDEMRRNSDANIRLFGRDFTYYASSIDMNTSATEHTNFVNLQHTYSIEFRLCKFINGEQYTTCAKLCRDIANAVIENFIKHFNDDEFDHNRYPNIRAYRKHKADVAAQKIVKLYRKYAGI